MNRSTLDRDTARNLLETAVDNCLGHRPYVPNERLRHMRIGDARVSKADGSQSLAEFEWELIRERTLAGLTAARGRHGGRTFALSKAQVRLAQAAMAHRDTSASAL